ncbi:MAG: hypothetical protein JNL36_06045 [Candidatus Kapabacteria bacterium]|nr:hypothetical protein [Candidatus Kapabacteria bacterium]
MKIAILLFLVLSQNLFSQQIPSDRLYDWEKAGATIPANRTNARVISILDFGAVPNDTLDDANAIQNAINSTNGTFTIVEIPEGTFILSKGISLRDSVILKGISAEKSIFSCKFSSNGGSVFSISGSAPSQFVSIENTISKATNIVNAKFVTTPTIGQWTEIRMKNGSWDVNPASWASYAVGHISPIQTATENSVQVQHQLRFTTVDSLEPQIGLFTPRTFVGFECFSIQRDEDTVSDAGHNFAFNYAVNCWVRSVKSHKSAGAHILISKSSNITVSSSNFEESFKYDGSGTRGYGVCLAEHPNLCLIENTVFKTLRHAMMVKQGANGNVFAYNYSIEPKRTEPIADFSGDISVHGHYPFANLFEGNIVQNIIIDHYWGPAGEDNMYFRNRAELYGFIITSSTTPSLQQNIVANDITNTGLIYGQYMLNGSNHFLWGNRAKGVLSPSTSTGIQSQSLFSQSAPWYFSTFSPIWQSIGHPYNIATSYNPARDRYQQGNLCPCVTPNLTTSAEELRTSYLYTRLNELESFFSTNNECMVYTLTGTLLFSLHSIEELQSKQLSKGLYIITSKNKSAIYLSE